MSTQVIILNGGSSSGKTGIVRCLQSLLLPTPWLAFGVDTLVDAVPAALRSAANGIVFGPEGTVVTGEEFRALDVAWSRGIGAMARAGAHIVVDEVLLGGGESQRRWRDALSGLDVLWVGVRCDPEVAAGRELARGDRAVGMAASQADLVHRGVAYDLAVDTTHTESLACARTIAGHVTR